MKHLVLAVALLVHCLAYAAPCLKGVTDKDPLSYAVGEDIVFTVSLEGAESFPDGVSATWRRSGDDGPHGTCVLQGFPRFQPVE